MSIASGITLMGRTTAESLMESTCVVSRTTGNTPNDDGSITPIVETVYTGKCRLRFPTLRPQQTLTEGQSVEEGKGILSLPITGSADVRASDEALVTLGALDVGTTVKVRITAPFIQTHATARRFPVQVLF